MELPQDQTRAIAPMRQWVVDRLRSLREVAGYSQGDLANKMSVHLSRVSDFENNRSDYKASTVYRYARAIGVPMGQVFDGCPDWRGNRTSQVIVISKQEATTRLLSLGWSKKDAEEAVNALSR